MHFLSSVPNTNKKEEETFVYGMCAREIPVAWAVSAASVPFAALQGRPRQRCTVCTCERIQKMEKWKQRYFVEIPAGIHQGRESMKTYLQINQGIIARALVLLRSLFQTQVVKSNCKGKKGGIWQYEKGREREWRRLKFMLWEKRETE